MEPELIADYRCETGEGPLWHAQEQRLYWCDIPRGRIFRYDPATGQHGLFYEGGIVGGFTVQDDGALLLFGAQGSVRVLTGARLTTVIPYLPGEEQSRFNDVIADPRGRVFCGTMSSPEHPGTLYRLDPDGSIRPVEWNVGTSNGLGFTPDGRGLYYTDTGARVIYLYDYSPETGEISHRRAFLRLGPDDPGGPDGMTVDAEGYVWSARWNGGALYRYAPDGREVLRVPFPARKVSSVTFGGADYTDIYVTTALREDRSVEGPGAGALFRLRAGVRGVPEFLSAVHP